LQQILRENASLTLEGFIQAEGDVDRFVARYCPEGYAQFFTQFGDAAKSQGVIDLLSIDGLHALMRHDANAVTRQQLADKLDKGHIAEMEAMLSRAFGMNVELPLDGTEVTLPEMLEARYAFGQMGREEARSELLGLVRTAMESANLDHFNATIERAAQERSGYLAYMEGEQSPAALLNLLRSGAEE